mmetsp:Transcript_32794/g.37511  ORF Transcript_32794/g.37511 Transcript_32794/m.37511 type:complete len:86 (-) Transcript_32794:686-943(-)
MDSKAITEKSDANEPEIFKQNNLMTVIPKENDGGMTNRRVHPADSLSIDAEKSVDLRMEITSMQNKLDTEENKSHKSLSVIDECI